MYYFQLLEVMYAIKLIVLLLSYTTITSDSSCFMLNDGTSRFHHTSVSCSKVCQLYSLILMRYALKYVLHFIKN